MMKLWLSMAAASWEVAVPLEQVHSKAAGYDPFSDEAYYMQILTSVKLSPFQTAPSAPLWQTSGLQQQQMLQLMKHTKLALIV
jgi:hypothetical protein